MNISQTAQFCKEAESKKLSSSNIKDLERTLLPKSITKYLHYLVFLLVTIMTSPAFAEFKKAHTLLDKVKTGLSGLSMVTVTISCLWVGYKILYGGSTLRECSPIIIGAIVIASAAEISKLLVG